MRSIRSWPTYPVVGRYGGFGKLLTFWTVKDALGFVQWDVDDARQRCNPISLPFLAHKRPGATDIVEGPLACITRQIGDVFDLVPDSVGY